MHGDQIKCLRYKYIIFSTPYTVYTLVDFFIVLPTISINLSLYQDSWMHTTEINSCQLNPKKELIRRKWSAHQIKGKPE